MIFFLLCASPFGVGMPNPGERLGFNLVCKKCSPQNYKRGGGKIRVGGSCPKYPPQISPVSPRFPPVFPPFFLRFPSVFPRFPPFFPVFPRFSLLLGTKRRLGMGTLDPCNAMASLAPAACGSGCRSGLFLGPRLPCPPRGGGGCVPFSNSGDGTPTPPPPGGWGRAKSGWVVWRGRAICWKTFPLMCSLALVSQ